MKWTASYLQKCVIVALVAVLVLADIGLMFTSKAMADTETVEPFFEDDFERYSLGVKPSGYETVSADGDALVETVVTGAPGREGEQALKIRDDSTEGAAIVAKKFAPLEQVAVEFDYYRVASNVTNFGLYSGSRNSPDAVFQIRVNATGGMEYLNIATRQVIALGKTLDVNRWYAIRVEASVSTGVVLFVDGEFVANIPMTAAKLHLDHMIFQGTGTPAVGDTFYIDNFKLFGDNPREESPVPNASQFVDDFEEVEQLSELADYAVAGEQAGAAAEVTTEQAREGEQALNISSDAPGKKITLTRAMNATNSAKLAFEFYPTDSSGVVHFGLAQQVTRVIEIKLEADKLYFNRGGAWYLLAEYGDIKVNQWNKITVNVPDSGTSITHADVFVEDRYVGTAYYSYASGTVNTIFYDIENSSAYLDNVTLDEADPAFAIPRYDAQDVDTYKLERIPSVNGYLKDDKTPQTGALGTWDNTGGVAIDLLRTSVGVDVGEKQKISSIRIFDRDAAATPKQEDYELYYSDDNVTYTKIPGFVFNSYVDSGKMVHLFEFSGITARYVKVNSLATNTSGYTFAPLKQQEDIRAERRMDKEYALVARFGVNHHDADPASGSLAIVGDHNIALHMGESFASAGLDFGIITDIDAVEIVDNDATANMMPDDFEVYYSNNNMTYTKVDKPIASTRVENGRNVYRFSFPSVQAKWIKVHAIRDGMDDFLLESTSAIKGYSSVEAASYFNVFGTNRGGEGGFYTKSDGTLVMGYNDFEGTSDFAVSRIAARESTDGGYTWSEGSIILENEGTVNTMMAAYMEMENGDIAIFYLVKETGDICNLYMRRSSDGGVTWGERLKITIDPQGYTINSSGNRVTKLASGRILLPVSYSKNVAGVYGGNTTYAMIWYSDDDGYTWKRSPGTVNLHNGTLEPTVTELANGDILMSLRTRENNSIYKAISTDGGLRWSQPVKMALNSAGSTNVVITVPATGDTLLAWNNAVGVGNNPRNPLTVALSSDNGESWNVVRNLMEQKTAQSGFPVISFYGRKIFVQSYFSSGIYTTLRIMDIDTLYHRVNDSTYVDSLPKAETPNVVFDYESGVLYNATPQMSYSIDGGASWRFVGGEVLYLNNVALTSQHGIQIKDNGGFSYAPSDIQQIDIEETYNITYHLASGTNPEHARANYTFGEGYLLPVPTKTGYNFEGWYTNSDFLGSAVTMIGGMEAGDKTFWAKWGAVVSSIAISADPATIHSGETSIVTGTVHDYDGQPMEGIEVRLAASGGSLSSDHAISDGEGSFSVNFIAPEVEGAVAISVYAPGTEVFSNAVIQIAPEVEQPTQAAEVTLTADSRQIQPGETIAISGMVYDAEGIPLEGIEVRLAASGGSLSSDHAVSDEEGSFSVDFIASEVAGAVAISVSIPGSTISHSMAINVIEETPPAPESLVAAVTLDVPAKVERGETVVVKGTVRNAEDEPVSGATIHLVSSAGMNDKVISAEDGSFQTSFIAHHAGIVAVTAFVSDQSVVRTIQVYVPSTGSETGGNGSGGSGDNGDNGGGSGGNGNNGNGGGSPEDPSLPATIYIPSGRSGMAGLEGEIAVMVSPGAMSQGFELTVSRLDEWTSFPDGISLLSPVFEVSKDVAGSLKTLVTLAIHFDDEYAGTSAGTDASTSIRKPAIFYYDEGKQEWVNLGGIASGSMIGTAVAHLGKFAVFGVGEEEEGAPEDSIFTDVEEHWAHAGIQEAALKGLVDGYADGTFRPDADMSREEFAVLLARAFGLQGNDSLMSFADGEQVSSWARQAVADAVQAGIINGFEDGSFRPAAAITRSEMVAMIVRALQLQVDAGMSASFADEKAVPDWAKAYVATAARLGIVTGKENHTFAPNDTATRAEVVTILLRVLEMKEQ